MNVFTIPATTSFVDALAAGLLARANGDPMQLAAMTVLLPNRRAVRGLREAFLRKSGGRALLLPAIRPIGDVDEDALALGPGMDMLDSRVAIDPFRRQLILAQYLHATDKDRFTIEQALPMAAELGHFLDSVHMEGLSLEKLDTLVPEQYAAHWQDVLGFLKKVLRTHWPRQLERENAMDPGEHRRTVIERFTENLVENPPAGPVIAAGSTGSIPVTADLLKVVANLPNGILVLPGLDMTLDDAAWNDAIEEGHPQAGLQNLLNHIGITRADVKIWDDIARAPREHLISTLMRPAATLEDWIKNPVPPEAFENLTLIEAENLDAEAGAIAAIMRKHAGDKDATEPCVLVTPDRTLASRVAHILTRWNIAIDDSAGQKLSHTPLGAWLLLLADALHGGLPPVALLALLKHPLAAGGKDWPADAPPYRTFVRLLDRHLLRGPRPAEGFDGLYARLFSARVSEETRKGLKVGLRALQKLFAPTVICPDTPARLRAVVTLAEDLAATREQTGASRLWVGDTGEAAASLLAALFEQADVMPELDWSGCRAVLEAAMEQASIRPRFGTHPRLAILGPIEARLYQAQTMILGSLNEGTWPRMAEVDGWMSRPMRAEFGLPAPERAITLSAHDFCQGLGAANVIITHARNRDNAPTIPARWLQRLDAVCAASRAPDIRAAGDDWLALAHTMDTPTQRTPMAQRPAVNPPLSARPRSLRVTEISMLRHDPYGIYARHVLDLAPMDPLDAEPDHRERGTLIHAALEAYTKAFPKRLPPDAAKQLIAIGEKIFTEAADHPDIRGHWWPRFLRMARSLVQFEQTEWREGLVESWAEASATMALALKDGDFTLRGRADRIERRTDGWAVIDYKSGAMPSAGSVKSGDEPQLTLLGAMLLNGAFDSTLGVATPDTLAALAYWPAGGNKDVFAPQTVKDDLDTLAANAKDGLTNLVRAYLEDGIPYLCWPDTDRPLRDDYDYAHLGRIAEWSGDGAEDDAA